MYDKKVLCNNPRFVSGAFPIFKPQEGDFQALKFFLYIVNFSPPWIVLSSDNRHSQCRNSLPFDKDVVFLF